MSEENPFVYAITRMLGHTGIVIIDGPWQSGKSDIALLIAFTLKKLGIIKHIVTNIPTDSPDVTIITSMSQFTKWRKTVDGEWLWIFDEAGEHAFLRDSATKLSKAIVKMAPQLSKGPGGSGRMILITQTTEFLDRLLKLRVWTRGRIHRTSENSLRYAMIVSDRIPEGKLELNNIPSVRDVCGVNFQNRTPTAFSLDDEEEKEKPKFKDEELNLAQQWVNGATWKDLHVHRETAARITRRIVKEYLKIASETQEILEKQSRHTSQATVEVVSTENNKNEEET